MEIALGRNVGTEMESSERARAGALQDACLSPLIASLGGRADVRPCPCVGVSMLF